jgi:hypothetical protein
VIGAVNLILIIGRSGIALSLYSNIPILLYPVKRNCHLNMAVSFIVIVLVLTGKE